tara:strand:+ start:41723 stop:42463 length:741 start_codon:yes stop_codon:yes gene_type:complete
LSNQRLAAVILLRVKEIAELHAAYVAFQAEADYGARVELETALGELDGTVTSLSAAVAAFTGGTAAPFLALAPIAQRISGETAEAAQRRRLMQASVALREIDGRLVDALIAEASIFASLSETLATSRANFADTLLAAGITDPLPNLRDFLARNELAASDEIKSTDRRAVVIARTVAAYRARRTISTANSAYEANIKALRELIKQHESFEEDEGVSLDGLTFAISELTAWADLVAAVNQARTVEVAP